MPAAGRLHLIGTFEDATFIPKTQLEGRSSDFQRKMNEAKFPLKNV